MGLFENYAQEVRAIELEIERKGIALGIDWDDAVAVRLLAQEAVCAGERVAAAASRAPLDTELHARTELFGLAAMMLKTMEESARDGMEIHGGPIWKCFGRALWQEATNRGLLKERA